MRGVLRRLLQGRHHDVLDLVEQDRRWPARAWLVDQAVQPPGDEPGPPLVHRRRAAPPGPRRPACSSRRRRRPARSGHRSARNCAVFARRAHPLSSARSSSVSTRSAFGRPARGSSSRPAIRCAANRDRHLLAVGTLTENCCATAAFDKPSAHARTIPARSASRRDPPSTARSNARRSARDSTTSTARGPGRDITTL